MSLRVVIILVFLMIVSCKQKMHEISNTEIIEKYIEGLNNSEFGLFSPYLNDSIIWLEADITICKSITEMRIIFQWDSVFSPVYKLIDVREYENKIEAIISKECDRIRFLHDSATVYRSIFQFHDGKISEIASVENIIFDVDKWNARRDSLVVWIDANYPDLNGFVFNQTIQGANDYMKAIYLYTRNQ